MAPAEVAILFLWFRTPWVSPELLPVGRKERGAPKRSRGAGARSEQVFAPLACKDTARGNALP